MSQPVLVVRVAANVEEFKKNLQEGVDQIEVVKTSLARMASSYDPQVLITKAQTTAAAIQQIGGVAMLSADQAARANKSIVEGLEAAERAGKQVPAGLYDIAAATKEAGGAATGLSAVYKQFDGVLQSVGINLGPQVKGLEDIARAAGSSATALGLVGTAGLALGAAAAGWGIGRMIADWFDLDKKISGAADAMLKAEVAGARLDVINLASQRTGRTITDLSEAMRLNKEYVDALAAGHIDWNAKLAATNAELDKFSEKQLRDIELGKKMGATNAQLRQDYGISSDALAIVSERLKVYTEENSKAEAAAKKHADALSELEFAGDGWKTTLEGLGTALVDEIKNYLKAGVSQSALAEAYGKTAQQIAAVKMSLDEEAKATAAAEANARKFANVLAENTAIELSMTGTRQQAKAAEIEASFQKEVANLNKLDQNYHVYYDELKHQRDLKLQSEEADYTRINAMSKTALQERADQELKTLEVMQARSADFSANQIAQQKNTWLAATDAVRNFGLAAVNTLDDIATKAKETADRIDAFMNAATLNSRVNQATSYDTPNLNGYALQDVVARFHEAGDTNTAQALTRALSTLSSAEGTYAPKNNTEFFAMQRDQVLLAQLRQLHGSGTVPGFAGGVRNFGGGVAMVGERGPELVRLPGGSDVIPNNRLGGVTIQINLSGSATKRDGDTVANAILDVFKGQGMLLPGGVGA